uniref:Odorant receptor n=1 Tax=Ctenopseustis herana TaxID=65029 RepID=A0A097ITX6_9NEOP|nr:olfactory receptor 35 [Ctenopseustis herana]
MEMSNFHRDEKKSTRKKEISRFDIRNIFKFLEDPEHPSVGPHLGLLSLTGQWHPNETSICTRLKLAVFSVTVFLFCSQYVKCFVHVEINSLLLILQYAPFHMGIIKTTLFQKDYSKWKELISYMSSTERRQISEDESEVEEIMDIYIKRGRRVTYFFWALAFFSNFSIFSEPYQKNQTIENGTDVYVKIFNFVTPFNQDVPPGYYVSMVIQTVLGHIVSAYVVAWDTLVVSTMIFFAGQLKISRIYCVRVIEAGSAEQSHRNIVMCHQFHVSLVKYQKLFNSLISSVMFVYLVVVSVNLGVCIIQLSQLKDDLAALMASVLFVVACLIQLLIFYWYGSQVTEESVLVSYGIFESDWFKMDAKVLKEVLLLQLATSKRLVFRAGPFNEMSLTTFVAILRSSYSFYTLLNETK